MRWFPIVALVAGCTGSSFSKDDSNAVMTELIGVSATTRAGMPGATSIDQTIACAGGGTAGVSGEFSASSFDLMTTFSDCNVGNGLVINGAPYLATTGTFTDTSFNLAFTGAVTANGDTCNIDFRVTQTGASGSICGNSVSFRAH